MTSRFSLSGGFDLNRISYDFVVVIGRCADHGIAAQNSNRMQSAALLARKRHLGIAGTSLLLPPSFFQMNSCLVKRSMPVFLSQ